MGPGDGGGGAAGRASRVLGCQLVAGVGRTLCGDGRELEGAGLSQERARQEGAPVRNSPLCVDKSVLYICLHSFPANRFIGTIFLDSIFVH